MLNVKIKDITMPRKFIAFIHFYSNDIDGKSLLIKVCYETPSKIRQLSCSLHICIKLRMAEKTNVGSLATATPFSSVLGEVLHKEISICNALLSGRCALYTTPFGHTPCEK